MTITDRRAEAVLNKVFRYPEGTMSRRQWVELMLSRGWKPETTQTRNQAAEEKLRQSIGRRLRGWDVPTGNECHPLTKQLRVDQELLLAGIFGTKYWMGKDGSLYGITKTEYDYAITLNSTI